MQAVGEQDEVALARDELAAWQEGIRQRALAHLRHLPSWPRRWRLGAIALLLLLHVIGVIVVRDAMRVRSIALTPTVEVRLLPDVPEPALPEPPRFAQPHAFAPTRAVPPTAAPAPSVAAPETPLRIFTPDGRIDLPVAPVATAPSASFTSPSPAPSALMGPRRPLKVRPNYFDQYWRAPVHNDTLTTSINHFVEDHLTVHKEFRTPWSSKVKCQVAYVVMVLGACAWGFPPEWGKPLEPWKPASVLDER